MQNSFFVASVTVSDGENPDGFIVGFKIRKVYITKAKVVIGDQSKTWSSDLLSYLLRTTSILALVEHKVIIHHASLSTSC